GSADRCATASAQRDDAVDPASISKTRHYDRGAFRHSRYSFATISFCGQRGNSNPRRLGNLGARDVGSKTGSADGSNINHESLMTSSPNLIGHKGVFGAFGIKRSKDDDRGHG